MIYIYRVYRAHGSVVVTWQRLIHSAGRNFWRRDLPWVRWGLKLGPLGELYFPQSFRKASYGLARGLESVKTMCFTW